jgi:(1->4)-alpha-D-glucan 1-alpha-D-glucosylmutase
MTSSAWLGSTYRLQLNGLGFSGARALVPYLDRLGIETLYASPVLAAAPGSTHGYDVIDPNRLDPALGSEEEFEALLDELAAHGMRMLLDIVPNHMAAVRSNRWWWETLRQGQASVHANTFDIDWTQHGGRVLLPGGPRDLHRRRG